VKRTILIVSLFVILVGISVVEEILLKQNLTTLYNKSVNLKNLVEEVENVNSNLVLDEIDELDEFWKSCENYICIVINHINIEEVGEQLTKIKLLGEQNKKEELIIEINLLIYYSKSYEHMLIPSLQNIL